MSTLQFNPEFCEECRTVDCIMKCQYIDMDLATAKKEQMKLIRGEKSEILTRCVTCYACEEYCPFHNHPFYYIVERQEALDIHPVPRPIEKSQVVMMAPKRRIEEKAVAAPVINLCYFPMLKGSIRGPIYEGASVIMGSDIFCNLMFLHFARNSTIRERLPKMMENIMHYYLKPGGVNEIVCYHDECYGTYTSWAPAFGIDVPFRPVHLFDFLHRRLTELKSRIMPLNLKVAYQRPCSNRLCPETEHFVDDIFALIGVERLERTYDHGQALCCGGVMEAQQLFDLATENQEKNVNDMKASGATHAVFNCPFCFFTLMGKVSEKGMTPILMSDLCRMALGEQ
jgi:Fe-S oxidoreductase